MSTDFRIELPEGVDEDDEDVQQLFALIAAGLDYETLLLRVRGTAAPTARVQDPMRGRQTD